LAAQFVRRLDFAAALLRVHEAGYRTFVEVGAGDVVTKLVTKNLANGSEERAVVAVAAAPVGEQVTRGLARVAELVGSEDATLAPSEPALAAAELGAVARLLRDAAERIERASELLGPRQAGQRDPVETPVESPVAAPQPAAPEPSLELPIERAKRTPIAVTAMGCVLPGAADPEEFWRHVLDGTSGIVDLAALDPGLRHDFVAEAGAAANGGGGEVAIVSDKTYTLLSGAIRDVRYDAARLGRFYDEAAFGSLTRGQKLLASAVAQAVAASPASAAAAAPARTQCI